MFWTFAPFSSTVVVNFLTLNFVFLTAAFIQNPNLISPASLLMNLLSLKTAKAFPVFLKSNFIFAVFAEEFGLIGSTLFLGFLVLFSYVSLRIAIKSRNNYTKLVAIGCLTLLAGQSIMHIAVATGTMPTTGLPLPFVSYGGNSLLSSFFVIGMLLRCSLESTGFIGVFSVRKSLN